MTPSEINAAIEEIDKRIDRLLRRRQSDVAIAALANERGRYVSAYVVEKMRYEAMVQMASLPEPQTPEDQESQEIAKDTLEAEANLTSLPYQEKDHLCIGCNMPLPKKHFGIVCKECRGDGDIEWNVENYGNWKRYTDLRIAENNAKLHDIAMVVASKKEIEKALYTPIFNL